MKQFQVEHSQSENVCKNHPYCLQSKCLPGVLDAQENVLFACLGWQKQNKYSCEEYELSKYGLA